MSGTERKKVWLIIARVLFYDFSFSFAHLELSKDMQGFNDDSKLAEGVDIRVNGCLFVLALR